MPEKYIMYDYECMCMNAENFFNLRLGKEECLESSCLH